MDGSSSFNSWYMFLVTDTNYYDRTIPLVV